MQNYTHKECLRVVKFEQKKIEPDEKASRIGRFPFLGLETLYSSKVTFVSHCEHFNCFYIDTNERL